MTTGARWDQVNSYAVPQVRHIRLVVKTVLPFFSSIPEPSRLKNGHCTSTSRSSRARRKLMECDDLRLFQQWITQWLDLAEFEIVPVFAGKDTAEAIIPLV